MEFYPVNPDTFSLNIESCVLGPQDDAAALVRKVTHVRVCACICVLLDMCGMLMSFTHLSWHRVVCSRPAGRCCCTCAQGMQLLCMCALCQFMHLCAFGLSVMSSMNNCVCSVHMTMLLYSGAMRVVKNVFFVSVFAFMCLWACAISGEYGECAKKIIYCFLLIRVWFFLHLLMLCFAVSADQ